MDLSVVVPVYNEAGSIEALVLDFEHDLVPLFDRIEVIVVDDASTDETPEILERLAAERPWLDVQHAERNAGHGPSVLLGLHRASADWIFQIDSDGQFVVSEFPRLWALRGDADLVLGVREQRNDPTHRLLLTRAVRLAASLLARRRIRDVNTPFRLLRRSTWNELEPLIDADTLAPNIFVTVGVAVRGRRIVNVPVTHLAREGAPSTLRALRLLRFSLRGLGQLIAFRYRLARAAPRSEVAAGGAG